MKGLMDKIGKTVKDHLVEAKLSSLEDEIRKYILREFVRSGRPPDIKEIAEGLTLSSIDVVNQTIEKLEEADILLRKGDNIVCAYPFSAIETPHKVILEDGREVYALCATDALGIHFMLAKDVTILSRCPECNKEIRVAAKDGKIDSYHPDGTIEFVSNRETDRFTAEALCPFINFFCSTGHLEEWRERNPEYRSGEIYSLSEALEHGKNIFGDFLK